jgi:transcriptional regulator with XRE-family HTH domain
VPTPPSKQPARHDRSADNKAPREANKDHSAPRTRATAPKPAETPSAFGTRLRTYREQRGLTLTQLSEETGHSKGYLSSLENNHQERRPSAEVLYTLAQALGVTMSDLMGRKLLPAAQPNDVPESLKTFAEEAELNEADLHMLASIQFRGEQPRTVDRWRFIYNSIRTSRQMDET